MSSHTDALALRRRLLVLRSARLRGELADEFRAITDTVGRADRFFEAARRYTARPYLVAAGAVLILLVKPARALAWAGKGLVVLSIARRVLRLVQVVRGRASGPRE